MDNLHQLFLERHSIRRYTDAPVDPDHVRLILQAALLSPSSKSKRPWQFVVVENRDTLARLAECKDFGTKPIGTCAFGVVVAVDAAESDCFVEDASIAAAFMQLQATELGLVLAGFRCATASPPTAHPPRTSCARRSAFRKI